MLFPWPGIQVVLVAFAFYWLGGLGTTVAYHRALAHRALTLRPWVLHLLIGFAVFNGSGAPESWVANHRLHHAAADTPGDVSSPRYGGFWWSHLRWLWQAPTTPVTRYAPDLLRPSFAIWRKLQPLALVASLCIGGLFFGWPGFFWIGAIRLVAALHAQCAVNSFAHLKKDVPEGKDSSLNLGWLAPFHSFQGENWHANHHAEPNVARLGQKWWQVDVGWYVILGLERLGLAARVRRVKGRKAA